MLFFALTPADRAGRRRNGAPATFPNHQAKSAGNPEWIYCITNCHRFIARVHCRTLLGQTICYSWRDGNGEVLVGFVAIDAGSPHALSAEEKMMNPNRKLWNQQQQELRQSLNHSESLAEAKSLFLSQHAMVHTARMSQSGLWSFEDEVLEGLSVQQIRLTPRNCDHSIAWVLWHITRIEDVTMNLLVAGNPQVLLREDWPEKMKVREEDTGNAMTTANMAELSEIIDLEALRKYRLYVGRQSREIVKSLHWEQIKQRVDPDRLQQIVEQGAVPRGVNGLLEYWGGLTVAGLLLMPPTRHNFIHLNEALRVRQKLK
jgi:hypothetical protein